MFRKITEHQVCFSCFQSYIIGAVGNCRLIYKSTQISVTKISVADMQLPEFLSFWSASKTKFFTDWTIFKLCIPETISHLNPFTIIQVDVLHCTCGIDTVHTHTAKTTMSVQSLHVDVTPLQQSAHSCFISTYVNYLLLSSVLITSVLWSLSPPAGTLYTDRR